MYTFISYSVLTASVLSGFRRFFYNYCYYGTKFSAYRM